ncbi:MAG: polysaccharide pyruvyl transferase family protein [Armatimonadota bacterium]|jgi:polysaccharide pyruvyl transferase WcaK-like protein
MTRKLLIQGATFENKGAEAMIRCVQRGIIAKVPDAMGLLDRWPHADWSERELRGLRPRACLGSGGRARRVVATAIDGIGRLLPERTRARCAGALLRVDVCMDAVLDITGYGAGDAWVRAGLRGTIGRALLDDAKLLAAAGVPFVYLPQSWGPFEKSEAREMAERRMQTALHLYVRDHWSLQWLEALPSFDAEKVSLASDIAFTFEGTSREVGRELLSGLGLRLNDSPVVGIVPNMRIYERMEGEGPENVYIRRLVAVARHFAERLDCQVVVMPHEIKLWESPVPDDRYLCELIETGASGAGTVKAAVDDYSSEELKTMIGELELLISSRYHSIIAAMSHRLPVVSVSWSHKYTELMDSVGLSEYVVECERLEDTSLIDLCGEAWTRRAKMNAALEEHVPTHEASARATLEETVALLREHLRA